METPQKILNIAELYVLAFIREQELAQARNLGHHLAMIQARNRGHDED